MGLVLAATASAARADEPTRLVHAVEGAGHELPPVQTLRKNCDDDMLCIARFIKDRIGDGAALVPAEDDAPGRTGWGRGRPPLGIVAEIDARTVIPVNRFDARALEEVLAAARGTAVLDLRATADDDIDAMRKAVALFTGTVARAFTVRHVRGRAIDWTIQAPLQGGTFKTPEVWIGPGTGPAAALFAALMHRHAGAVLRGQATPPHAFMTEDVPVIHGWALRVPTGALEMPDADLAKGVVPDGPALPQ